MCLEALLEINDEFINAWVLEFANWKTARQSSEVFQRRKKNLELFNTKVAFLRLISLAFLTCGLVRDRGPLDDRWSECWPSGGLDT